MAFAIHKQFQDSLTKMDIERVLCWVYIDSYMFHHGVFFFCFFFVFCQVKYTKIQSWFKRITTRQDVLVSYRSVSTLRSSLCWQLNALTHWGRVTHICASELTIIGSDNGLSPGRRQAIIWNNAWLLLIEPSGTNFSEISIGIQTFSFKKMHLNMSSAKWRPFCLGLSVLIEVSGSYQSHIYHSLSY